MNELKEKILLRTKDDILKIEEELKNNLNPYLDLVSKIAGHILFSGGKRLRPLLMVLSAKICNYKGSFDKTFSTIFEYIHTATLLHDDLIDKATKRRGKPVANLLWGNSVSILVGDFLLSRSLSIASEANNIEIIKVVAKVTEDLSQGEIHQLISKDNINLTEKEYLEIIKRKTAVLFKGACLVSACLANASEKKKQALADYGYNLGIAFQLVDDVLDYTANAENTGKEIGADLKEGRITLPLIYALNKASKDDNEKIKDNIKNFYKKDNIDNNKDNFNIIKNSIDKYGGINYTKTNASKFIQKAKDALLVFDDCKTKETLLMIAEYALTRTE